MHEINVIMALRLQANLIGSSSCPAWVCMERQRYFAHSEYLSLSSGVVEKPVAKFAIDFTLEESSLKGNARLGDVMESHFESCHNPEPEI